MIWIIRVVGLYDAEHLVVVSAASYDMAVLYAKIALLRKEHDPTHYSYYYAGSDICKEGIIYVTD